MVSQRALDPDRPSIHLILWRPGREAGVVLGAGIAGLEPFGYLLSFIVLSGVSDLVGTPGGLEGYSGEVEGDSGLCCWALGSSLQASEEDKHLEVLIPGSAGVGCRA